MELTLACPEHFLKSHHVNIVFYRQLDRKKFEHVGRIGPQNKHVGKQKNMSCEIKSTLKELSSFTNLQIHDKKLKNSYYEV